VRCLEQAEQRCGLLLGARLGVEVVARQLGKAELGVGRKGPGQIEVDLACQHLRPGDQFGGRGLLESEQQVDGLDLDTLARVELDLCRAVGFGHQPAGVELPGVFEQSVHRLGIVADDRQ
jgi:hypothetical protein